MKQIWYLKFPLSLYKETKEEIKEIARKNNLKIVSDYYGSNDLVAPKLTLINQQEETIEAEILQTEIEQEETIEAPKKRGRKPKEI